MVASAVLGLYPLSHQGLLRDLEALVEEVPTVGPIVGFLDAKAELGKPELNPVQRFSQSVELPSLSRQRRRRQPKPERSTGEQNIRSLTSIRVNAGQCCLRVHRRASSYMARLELESRRRSPTSLPIT